MKFALIIISVLLLSCTENKKIQTEISTNDLIGKTIEYKYGEAIYHVTLDTDSTMHWEAMAGDEKGTSEKESYFMEPIGCNKIFISWDEASGIGVSQVLDFNEGKVYNHLLQDRKLQNGYGEIRILP